MATCHSPGNQSLGYSKLDLYRSFQHDVTAAMHIIGLQNNERAAIMLVS